MKIGPPKGTPSATIKFEIDNSKHIDDAVRQSSIDGIATERIGSSSGGAVIGAHFVTVTEGWPSGQEVQVDNSGMQKSSPPRSPRRVVHGRKKVVIRRALLSKSKS
ncbi:MAG: hypothetical protein KGQ60_13750, partial [Planctomycetes bacterium]|nr:hypothetical protein [Planctomycetota bacterium]